MSTQVVNHLLFHKAMVGIDGEKIDQYIEIAGSASSAAEVSTIEDPFTRCDASFHAGERAWT